MSRTMTPPTPTIPQYATYLQAHIFTCRFFLDHEDKGIRLVGVAAIQAVLHAIVAHEDDSTILLPRSDGPISVDRNDMLLTILKTLGRNP